MVVELTTMIQVKSQGRDLCDTQKAFPGIVKSHVRVGIGPGLGQNRVNEDGKKKNIFEY